MTLITAFVPLSFLPLLLSLMPRMRSSFIAEQPVKASPEHCGSLPLTVATVSFLQLWNAFFTMLTLSPGMVTCVSPVFRNASSAMPRMLVGMSIPVSCVWLAKAYLPMPTTWYSTPPCFTFAGILTVPLYVPRTSPVTSTVLAERIL